MAARGQNFVCQSCGAAYRALGRPLRSLRRMEHARRGRRCEGHGAFFRARGGFSPSSRSRANRMKRRGLLPASPNSIASPAAVWSAVRCCCSAAIRASANRPCCSKWRPRYARHGHRAVYISGEEAVAQVRLRAERLGLSRCGGRTRRRDLGRGHRRDAVAGRTPRDSSSSIPSRPCGRKRSKRRPAP